MLRDRLVCGMNDHKLQYELLKKNKLSYKDVVDAILSSESAEKDVRMIVIGSSVSDESTSSATPSTFAQAAASTTPEPMDVNAVHSKRTSGGTSTRLCYRCGDHHGGECRFANAICRYCKKKGHLEKICLAKKKGGNRTVNYTHIDEEQDEYIGGIYNVDTDNRVPPFDVQVALNGAPQRMQVDTGAAYSLLNERTWRALARPPLRQPPIALRTWTSAPLEMLGQTTLHVQYKGITRDLSVFVAKGTVVSKGGPSSYQVETTDGSLVNRHIDQLIKTTAEDSTVTDRVLPEDEVIRGEGTTDEDNNDKCTEMESTSDAD
ncbi:uncharacterized protein LOC133516648 [Cydia pomonella]|uniref:uncharacterized protein LOC133516648 n=1 Tax=Cydia pomonella TaxID=82600 RepID=UPI002ADE42C4|nr:uncharacterized protein LOC133516648 [Cydia pomonella]